MVEVFWKEKLLLDSQAKSMLSEWVEVITQGFRLCLPDN